MRSKATTNKQMQHISKAESIINLCLDISENPPNIEELLEGFKKSGGLKGFEQGGFITPK